jgi:hypothetical protein
VKDRFDLKLIDRRFCELLPACDPQSEFLAIFDESSSLAEVAKSEKAKSELLVSPILVQARKLVDRRSRSVCLSRRRRASFGRCNYFLVRSLM